jgi:sulfate transport system substrate-binding protein
LAAAVLAGGTLMGLAACSSSKTAAATDTSGAAAFTCPTTTSGEWAPTTTAAATAPTSGSGGSVNLVAYSVPKPAYDKLTKDFQATPAGAGVSFHSSFGASGTQAKNVLNGQAADYVALSVGSDMSKLVPSHVAATWKDGATKGIVSDSVVVLVVRKGNPKHICGWDDLIRPGVQIVTPDPASSGSAKWNILAAYEHVLQNGGTAEEAKTYLSAFFKNVVSRASSGAIATSQFTAGTGDVLISYEDEAIDARQAGQAVDYVVPAQSILIENPAAVTTTAPTAAANFLAYVESTAGQTIFAQAGFRPVIAGVSPGAVSGANDPANPFPNPQKLITISDLGGWTAVNKKFFASGGIVTTIESGS